MEPKLGVALTKCYYCNKDDRILMNSVLTPHHAARVESAHGKVIDMEPCDECKRYMDMGVILITIDVAKSAKDWNTPPTTDATDYWRTKPSQRRAFMPNPYRTGGWFVLKDEAVKRLFGEAADWAIKHRFMFIEHEAAEKIGLFDKSNHPETTKEPQ